MSESFGRLAIIGVGLIGGSLARALRTRGAVDAVVGCGRDRANLERAVALGVIDDWTQNPAEAARGADIVVVAVTLGATADILARIAPALAAQAIVTDGWRSAPLGVLCLRVSNDPSASEAARASSTLREGMALLAGEPSHGLQTLGCAHLAGDEALEAEARTHNTTDRARSAFEAERATAPWSAYAELATLRGS